jgi:hypothetical protein
MIGKDFDVLEKISLRAIKKALTGPMATPSTSG